MRPHALTAKSTTPSMWCYHAILSTLKLGPRVVLYIYLNDCKRPEAGCLMMQGGRL